MGYRPLRHQRELYNTLQTSQHSCGKSNSLAEHESSLCEPILVYLVLKMVRVFSVVQLPHYLFLTNTFWFSYHLNCMSIDSDVEKRAPITVKFEIPYFTVSGIQVRYLKIVEKSGYQALPWVRYITQNGDDYRYVLSIDIRIRNWVTDCLPLLFYFGA